MKIKKYFYQITALYVIVYLNSIFSLVKAQGVGSGISDIEGNFYQTVFIGKQEWMVKNLKTTKLNTGEILQNVPVESEWSHLSTPAYSWYDNDIKNSKINGGLYNWYTVNTGKLCPVGWHVPSDNEWEILVDYLGGFNVAGGKLKENDTISWLSPNKGATNISGFTGLASGNRCGFKIGPFLQIGYYCDWWSSTEFMGGTAWSRRLHYNNTEVSRNTRDLKDGCSVRCLKD